MFVSSFFYLFVILVLKGVVWGNRFPQFAHTHPNMSDMTVTAGERISSRLGRAQRGDVNSDDGRVTGDDNAR